MSVTAKELARQEAARLLESPYVHSVAFGFAGYAMGYSERT
jgi:hypothetical protein